MASKVKKIPNQQSENVRHCGCGNIPKNPDYTLTTELAEKAFYFYTGAFINSEGNIKPLLPLCLLPENGCFTSYIDGDFDTDNYSFYYNYRAGSFILLIEIDASVADQIQAINEKHFNNWDANDFSDYIIENINFVEAGILSSISKNKVIDVANSVFSQTEMMVPELIYGGSREGMFSEDVINFVGFEESRLIFKLTWNSQHIPQGTYETDFVNVFIWIPEIQETHFSSYKKARFSEGEVFIELPAYYEKHTIFVLWQVNHDESLFDDALDFNAGNDLAGKIKQTTVNLPPIEKRAEFLWEICKVQPASLKFKEKVGGFATDIKVPGHIILPKGEAAIELSSKKLDEIFFKHVDNNGKVVIINIPPSDDYKVSIIAGAETYVIEKTYTISPHFIHQAENIMNENFHVVVSAINKTMIAVKKSFNGNISPYPDATVSIKCNLSSWSQNRKTDVEGKSIFKKIPVPINLYVTIQKNNTMVLHPKYVNLTRVHESQTTDIIVEVDENDIPQRIII